MDRAELVARAAPECRDCGAAVQHTEIPWRLDHDGHWRLGPAFMVCPDGHRVFVAPV